MTDTAVEVKVEEPKWHQVPTKEYRGWISDMFCMPDMEHPDRFIITMDGPRGGEHARIRVSRQQLLEMIVASDKERERVKIVRQQTP